MSKAGEFLARVTRREVLARAALAAGGVDFPNIQPFALTGAVPPPPPLTTSRAVGGAGAGTKRTEIKPGMTTGEVRAALGDPDAEVVFGDKTRWSYPGMTVVFQKGKVADVQF